MHEQHRMSLKNFIHHLVTAQPEESHAAKTESRTRKLSETIYEQDEVLAALRKVPKSASTNEFMTTRLVADVQAELSQFGSPAVGLGQFDAEEPVDQLDIPGMASRVQAAAPCLWALLVSIMTPQHPTARDTSEDYQGSIFMVCVMLASAFAPQTCNKFPISLGLHLQSNGAGRRTLDLLFGLGIVANYVNITQGREEIDKLGKVKQ
ncbi:uncharacterized protein N7515_004051 [Penicillium bovifimosum]|uniref:Uncharacterized protein n=1 Tax=Penicillium bovifimosum TaxID=126998 RepID=A0A9W9H613_9EURO|nr:uncharacterized protein N7515_004051 [Penicillium bovifimosum]KAJ5139203.1 hypothetical protein N7515_004051 [Penicillium bovifimosum]